MVRDDDRYVIGVDYGTLSGRALVVRVSDGAELGSAVLEYPHGVVDTVMPGSGRRLPPDWALQVPSDYVEVLRTAVPAAVEAAGIDPADVIGIATDFTACTMVPTLADGTPLCDTDELRDEPHAYVKLWKHHAAQGQADRITELARERGEKWLARYGGVISSEWEFAKGLQLLEEAPEVYAAMEHWVEAADWIVWQLTGTYVRNACTAGYKGIRQDGAYPSRDYLAALNPAFERFVEDKVDHEIGELGAVAGRLSARAAAWTGLPEGIPVAVGNVDAHVSAPAADAVAPGQMVADHGHLHLPRHELATCSPRCRACAASSTAASSPGLYGYEAGQSGVGDIFGWFVANPVPPVLRRGRPRRGLGVHEHLTALAAEQPIGAHGLVALDWWSGNRSVLVDHDLSGLLVGLTLTTRPEDVYRALLESTAFGARVIVETFAASGVPVTEFIVDRRPAEEPPAHADLRRRARHAAVGRHLDPGPGPGLGPARRGRRRRLSRRADRRPGDGPAPAGRLHPVAENVAAYDRLYAVYRELHDHFGRGASGAMRTLKSIRREAQRMTATTPLSDAVRATLDRLRAEVADLHAELVRYGLVIWTAGNVSARVPGATSWSSSPRGVSYDDLDAGRHRRDRPLRRPRRGRAAPVVRHRRPRLRLPAHAARRRGRAHPLDLRHRVGRPPRADPCVLTMIADEFGGEIPVGPFALIGDDSIGRGIVETLQASRSRAVLMARPRPLHGRQRRPRTPSRPP